MLLSTTLVVHSGKRSPEQITDYRKCLHNHLLHLFIVQDHVEWTYSEDWLLLRVWNIYVYRTLLLIQFQCIYNMYVAVPM